MIKRLATISIALVWLSLDGFAQDTTSTSAIVLPRNGTSVYTVPPGGNANITSDVSVTLQPAVALSIGSTVNIRINGVMPTILNKNWILTQTYDEGGSELGATKSFFDNNGKLLQTQTKNESAGRILATATVYDLQGRAALTTLPAPINGQNFSYKSNFISSDGTNPYDYSNFDWNAADYRAYARAVRPDPIDSTHQGTLGWYYSNNNTLEPLVGATVIPYQRTNFYHDGTSAVNQRAGIGKELSLGQGLETTSNSFPVQNELNNYLTIRNQCFPSSIIGATPASIAGQALQTLTTDQNAVTTISITDLSGKMQLMSGRADLNGWLSITDTATLNNRLTYFNPTNYTLHEPAANSVHYFQIGALSRIYTSGQYKLYDMSTEGPVSWQVMYNLLNQGYYKITADAPLDSLSTNNVSISYNNRYSDVSYYYYNQLGQLIASVAPKGVQMLVNNPGNYTSASQLPFTTLYEYDLQGRMIASTTVDGGRTEYAYRTDGKIRFSQNAAQRAAANGGRFSYTSYDKLSRPFESGEFVPQSSSDSQFATLKNDIAALDNVTYSAGMTGGIRQDWVKTYYDTPDNSYGLPAYVQDAGFLKGAVSWTENANSKTWYNYDDHGRVLWVLKQITGLGTVKTINYNYNDQGNVSVVDYQKENAAERMMHIYTYDADARLSNVQTSRDGMTMVQQAKYTYYLHGPLKRVTLGDNTQGMDYVYTPQGWLKSINNPIGDPAKDPGHDGTGNGFAADAFGMQLEYFSGDYQRNGVSIASVSKEYTSRYGAPNYYDYNYNYNGNVSGLSWQSKKPQTVVNTYGTSIQDPTMYLYSYDPKYQLTGAAWGTPNYTNNSFTAGNQFSEYNIGYDPNGNITGLQRTNASGALSDDFSSYQYQSGTNKLNTVGSASNPSGYGSYTYDELGRVKSASQAGAPFTMYMKYDVTGKITGIYSDAALTQQKVGYTYDETGKQIARTDYTGSQPVSNYYVYDASGNPLAVYNGAIILEIPFYGSHRLGMYTIASNNYTYEIRDNVGSVRAVINRTLNSSGQADVVTYNDYYPFGSIARSGGATYRYDYQGAYAEKDSVTGLNNFDLRMYNGKIGRWMSTDPMGQYASPYEGMNNNPGGSDPTGGWDWYTNNETGNITWFDGNSDVAGYTHIGGDDYVFPGSMLNQVDITAKSLNTLIPDYSKYSVNQGGNNNGFTKDQYLFNFGLVTSTAQTFSGVSRLGSNLTLYSATERGGVFLGNQFVKTLGIAKIAKGAGIAGAVLGVGIDGYGFINGTVSGGKFAGDTGMAALGLTGIGTVPALIYFGIDAYYPGGFPAAIKNAAPVYNQINQPTTFITAP